MTAFGMRISVWSSDVCSSDLLCRPRRRADRARPGRRSGAARKGSQPRGGSPRGRRGGDGTAARSPDRQGRQRGDEDRKSDMTGKRVSVRGKLGGERVLKTEKKEEE